MCRRRAIAIDPGYAAAYVNRAWAHEALGNTAQMERDVRMYRELGGR